MSVTTLNTPRSGIDTYFIAGDWHSHHLDKSTYNIMVNHAIYVKSKFPKRKLKLIINGDFIDAAHFMAKKEEFKKWIKLKEGIEDYFLPLHEKEMEWANNILDELEMIFDQIIFICGNHCWRVDWFSQVHAPAAYKPAFNLQADLHLRKRKIEFIRYNDWLDIGHLSITHGMFHSTTSNKKHYEASGGRSVIYSHIHKASMTPFMSRGDTKQVWSLPAMCNLNPEYIKNTETNWSNGYGIINMKPNGNFNFNTFQVWDNELILPSGDKIKDN